MLMFSGVCIKWNRSLSDLSIYLPEVKSHGEQLDRGPGYCYSACPCLSLSSRTIDHFEGKRVKLGRIERENSIILFVDIFHLAKNTSSGKRTSDGHSPSPRSPAKWLIHGKLGEIIFFFFRRPAQFLRGKNAIDLELFPRLISFRSGEIYDFCRWWCIGGCAAARITIGTVSCYV